MCGIIQFCSPRTGEKGQARAFGGTLLVAAEETRSSAGGQHAQVLPRADAARARPRPAPVGWCEQHLLAGTRLHLDSAGQEDSTRRGRISMRIRKLASSCHAEKANKE
jgi:hypothetical protein